MYKLDVAQGIIPKPDELLKKVPNEQSAYLAGFLVQKYTVSEKWKDYNILIGDEYDEHSVDKVIQRLKLEIVQRMRDENLKKLSEAATVEEQDGQLEILARVDEFKNIISGALGRVVIGPPKLLEL